jgi:hypothetical protein
MLLEFGLKNFFSYKEEVSISFRLDSNCPQSISQGRDFSTVLGIKGANGSGKTHLLKGLAFVSFFCTNSFSDKPESPIHIDSFYDSDLPSEFYLEFMIGKVTYRYELSVTDTEIKRECIFRKNSKKTKILERVGNELIYRTAALARLDAIKLRKNASIISTAHQYDFDELNDIYNNFAQFVANVSYSGLSETPYDINSVSEFLHEHSDILEFVKSFIAECDTGITSIDIVEIKDNKGGTEFWPVFVHETNEKLNPVTAHSESSGTKALYRHLPSYKLILDRGGLLVLDEFDTHLHPHILPKLIQLFVDPVINKHSAQLVFSTHDAAVIDLLGRYRTYLVNKEDNESYAYRLDEIPGDIIRNDRSILPSYNDGKIGGIPKL